MTGRPQSASAWLAKVARLGELVPKRRLHPAVLSRLEKVRSRAPWAVALSGGADSVCLLLLLKAHWPERTFLALHFNHRLRGRVSAADARFCRRLCEAIGVRCMVGTWDRPSAAASEAQARTARHAFFAEAMKRHRSRVLWLAQQKDDIAETMLMRLARGSGTSGLAAPRPVQDFAGSRVHLRPLLGIRKLELIRALRVTGVAWREDETNATSDYFRNRVRQAVIPRWVKAAGRDAVAGAAAARELLEEDDEALEAWVDQLGALKKGVLDLRLLHGMPRAVLRRALHRWLLAVKPRTDLSRQGFDILLTAVSAGRATRFSLGSDHFAVVRHGMLTLGKAWDSDQAQRFDRSAG